MDIPAILKKVEAAIEAMEWKVSPNVPESIVESYSGIGNDGWLCVAIRYMHKERAGTFRSRFEGVASHAKSGTIFKLTEDLAQTACNRAREQLKRGEHD